MSSTITVTKTAEDAASKALRVTIPVERVREAEDKAVRQYAKRARLPGFRQGKAPDAVVRRRFSNEIRQWVIEEVIREGWEEAKTAESLRPIADPSVRNLKFEEGQPVEFELLVEVRPEPKLERLGGFTLTRSPAAVTDTMVTEQLGRLREQRATWLPVEGEKPAPGQMVRVEVAPIEEGEVKEAQPYSLVLGDGQAIPALEEKIMTLLPGETLDTEVRFPDDHPDPERRGKARTVRVTLHEVKRQELPPLDDSFAREVGDFETLDALTAAVREDLRAAAERDADAAVREQLVAELVSANQVEAPPSMVDRMLHGLLHAYEVPHEKAEAFYQEFRPIAVAQVRRELVLSTVAEREGLKPSEAELDARIARIAEQRKSTPAQVYASLEQAKRLPELERSLTEEKVFAWLLSQSTVSEAAS
ncbi:MAG TPA: trigger factor [Gemmatimonadales bacterium]|jgi:trigger factor|nr:trigger factor [Gemmatimonadales bacterium]